MGDSSFSDLLPSIDVPEEPNSSRNWSIGSDPFYFPLINSLFRSLHPESMLNGQSSQGSSSSSSNPQRAPISDDEKIELIRIQERVGDEELPNDWEEFEDLGNESPRENSNDSDRNSDRFGRSVYF